MAAEMMQSDPLTMLPSLGRLFSGGFPDPMMAAFMPLLEEGNLPVDIAEDDKNFVVRASLPGFKKEEVQAEVKDGVVAITARRAEEREKSGERFYRRERRVGSVSRRVALPAEVNEEAVTARLTDGVLTLTLPKAAKAAARKVNIN